MQRERGRENKEEEEGREKRKRREYRKVLASTKITFTIFLVVKLALWYQFTDGKTEGLHEFRCELGRCKTGISFLAPPFHTISSCLLRICGKLAAAVGVTLARCVRGVENLHFPPCWL